MPYRIDISNDVLYFLQTVPSKTKSIIKKNLVKLENPFPGRGSGDKEKLIVAGEEMYRLHIGRSYTAFYIIDSKEKVVRVIEVLTIELAHNKYGN